MRVSHVKSRVADLEEEGGEKIWKDRNLVTKQHHMILLPCNFS